MFQVKCPHCGSAEHTKVLWTSRNLLAIVGKMLFLALQTALALTFSAALPVDSEGWPLRRKCLKCGERFTGPQREKPNFDECPKCGYNLTGNVSGRCSECGWKLARRYRIHRRKADGTSIRKSQFGTRP